MIDFLRGIVGECAAFARELAAYLRAIGRKVITDDILFLASALAFNGLLTMVALLLLTAASIGWFMNSTTAGIDQLNNILNTVFPPQPFASSIKESISKFLADIIAHRHTIGIAGALVLVWTATSLFDSLRSALHTIYELRRTKSLLASFLHDIGFVVVALLLFIASNLAIWAFSFLGQMAGTTTGVPPSFILSFAKVIPTTVVVALTAVMFYMVYRNITDSKPPRLAATISTLTTTVLWVISGKLFGLYLTYASSIGKIYGAYAFLVVLMIWIYYSCILFVFGGIVGQVYWERKRQHDSFLHTGSNVT